MKQIMPFLLLATGLFWLNACTKDAATGYQQMDDAALAASIAADAGRETFDPEQLPAEAIAFLRGDQFDTYYEEVRFSRERGYEVRLATDERVYFNLRGRHLNFRGGPVDGPCGPNRGVMVPLDQIRPATVDYIHQNYPGAVILRAKQVGDTLLVLLSGDVILALSEAGVFEADQLQWRDCRCASADQVDMPAGVLAMIANRIPGGGIKRVCQRGDRIIVGVTKPDGRVILVFDAGWNFLFAHR